MDNIVDIKLGQSLPPERWEEAAEHMEKVFEFVANYLLRLNGDGMGKQDAKEFLEDATLALVAMRFVAAFHSEDCRFIPTPEKGG